MRRTIMRGANTQAAVSRGDDVHVRYSENCGNAARYLETWITSNTQDALELQTQTHSQKKDLCLYFCVRLVME